MPGLNFSNKLISCDEDLHCDFACSTVTSKVNYLRSAQAIIRDAMTIEQEFVTDALWKPHWDKLAHYEPVNRFCSHRLLLSLDYSKIYNSPNPFALIEMISVRGKTNFFERHVGE